jgi:hypothetical protein
MASSRFVDPPDELRACSEAFHAEAMKHLDAVFEEQSYSELVIPSPMRRANNQSVSKQSCSLCGTLSSTPKKDPYGS